MKKIILTITAFLFVFTSVGFVFAEEEPAGNKRKGKYTYRKVYSACMERGEVSEPKPVLDPSGKTQAEWTRVFTEKDFTDFLCKEEWNNLTDEQLLDIYTYLWSFAADSPTPAQCK
ncbi:MAG: cytochrome c family protein [Desulfobacterales bacterium]|nr:cytochrome c family protein [Desulfobacterales bacterium]